MQAVIASNISIKIQGTFDSGSNMFGAYSGGAAIFTVPANTYAIASVYVQTGGSSVIGLDSINFPVQGNGSPIYMPAGSSLRVYWDGSSTQAFRVGAVTFINSP